MEQNRKQAEIEESVEGKSFTLAGVLGKEARLKKILLNSNLSGNWVQQELPGAEIVDHANAILHDKEIDLVLMPESEKNNLEMVSAVLNTGKNLRIV